MIGKPKFKIGDKVSFKLEDKTITGEIHIIDPYGTFEDDSDVSYDIFSESENCLFKHINETLVRNE